MSLVINFGSSHLYSIFMWIYMQIILEYQLIIKKNKFNGNKCSRIYKMPQNEYRTCFSRAIIDIY